MFRLKANKYLGITLLLVTFVVLFYCGTVLFHREQSASFYSNALEREIAFDFENLFSRERVKGLDLSAFHEKPRKYRFDSQLEDMRSNISHICSHLSPEQCLKPLKRGPWIVLGTAGSGTRIIHDFLNSIGVHMSKLTNRQRDSLVFIEAVKKASFFSDKPDNPNNNDTFVRNSTVMGWLSRSGIRFDAYRLLKSTFEEAVESIDQVQQLISHELYSRTLDSDIEWGFKEPQAMFILPMLNDSTVKRNPNLQSDSAARMKIVHVVRDGRDIAFSSQHLRKYQLLYSRLFSTALQRVNISLYLQNAIDLAFSSSSCLKPESNDSVCIVPHQNRQYYLNYLSTSIPAEWHHNILIARIWGKVNSMAHKFGSQISDNSAFYQLVKLENVCSDKTIVGELYNIAYKHRNANISDIINFVQTVNSTKCRVRKFEHQDPVLTLLIEGLIHSELERFGYPVYGRNWAYIDEQNANDLFPFASLPNITTVLSQHPRSTVIVTYVTQDYKQILLNWLESANRVFNDSDLDRKIEILILTCDPDLYHDLLGGQNDHEWAKSYKPISESLGRVSKVSSYLIGHESAKFGETSNGNIWSYRLQVALSLLKSNHTVLLSDVDALFLKYPFKMLDDISADMVVSRGRFPYSLGEKWGATVCMGWALLRPSSERLIVETLSLLEILGDDQIAVNTVLDQFDAKFYSMLHGITAKTDKGSVAILEFDTVPRFCKDDLKEKLQVTFNVSVTDDWVRRIYPDAVAIHCYTPKDGQEKERWLKFRKLWFI